MTTTHMDVQFAITMLRGRMSIVNILRDVETATAVLGPSMQDAMSRCPYCDEELYKRHCKYVCEKHGVIIDCSDPFV